MHRKRYKTIGLGGTFDHFHAGHEKFITFASELAEEVFIGITHPQMTREKPYATTIEPWETRRNNVKQFCGLHRIRCHTSQLTDIYGPTLEQSSVQALAVTEETLPGAKKINTMRDHLHLKELIVFVCDYFIDETGQPLHAEAIRAGRVNRAGVVYQSVLDKTLVLSDEQRQFFSPAQGKVIDLSKSIHRHGEPMIAVVGDASLETFIANGWPYDLGVFDQRQLRKDVTSEVIDNLSAVDTVENPAGSISVELTTGLIAAILNKYQHLKITGEEDLAAVALILLLPLGSVVYYGQPGLGIVKMFVTEELKDTTHKILSL